MNSRVNEQELVRRIHASRKYRGVGIPEETILDVYRREMGGTANPVEVLKRVKAKIHNIIALYLGDLDYNQAKKDLDEAFLSEGQEAVERVSMEILACHHSTRERLPYYPDFIRVIQEASPRFETVLDLACGLNPFALPLLDLPADMGYHAYDIHVPRVQLINHLFTCLNRPTLAEVHDVLVSPPRIRADAALLLKEAHRMEKRRAGATRELILSLRARMFFISLPNRSMDNRRDLRERMRSLLEGICRDDFIISGHKEFPSETLFWLRRVHG